VEPNPSFLDYSHHREANRKPFPLAMVSAVLSWVAPIPWIAFLRKPLMDTHTIAPYLDLDTRRYLWLLGAPITFGFLGLLLLIAAYASGRRPVSAWWCVFGAVVWSIPIFGLLLLAEAFWSGFSPG
jgi:hypothetical protein